MVLIDRHEVSLGFVAVFRPLAGREFLETEPIVVVPVRLPELRVFRSVCVLPEAEQGVAIGVLPSEPFLRGGDLLRGVPPETEFPEGQLSVAVPVLLPEQRFLGFVGEFAGANAPVSVSVECGEDALDAARVYKEKEGKLAVVTPINSLKAIPAR